MKTAPKIRLLILDPFSSDQEISHSIPGNIDKVTYTTNLNDTFPLLATKEYDILMYIVDQSKPSRDILHQLGLIAHQNTESKILVASGWVKVNFLITCLKLGIYGFYNYRVPLVEAAMNLIKFDHYFGLDYRPSFIKIYKQQLHRQDDIAIDLSIAQKHLSKREIEVLRDIVFNGGTQEEIAGRLFISPQTLKNHTNSIRSKLGANNRTHIIRIALKKGILYTSSM